MMPSLNKTISSLPNKGNTQEIFIPGYTPLNKEAYLQGRLDARRPPRCSVGHRCGNTCIPSTKKCSPKNPSGAHSSQGNMSGDRSKISAASDIKNQPSQSLRNSAGSDRQNGIVADSDNPKVKRRLQIVENQILQNENHEDVVVVGHDGNVVAKIKGDETSVFIPDTVGKAFKNNILTHNHPAWRYPPGDPRLAGRSFSDGDLLTAAHYDVAEIRATAPGYTYSMKRGDNGWGDTKKIANRYQDHIVGVHKDLSQRLRNKELTAEQAEQDFQGEIAKRMAKDFGWSYKEEKRQITAKDKAKARKVVNKYGQHHMPDHKDLAEGIQIMRTAKLINNVITVGALAAIAASYKQAYDEEVEKTKSIRRRV